jgi:hypothetical protein
MNPFLKNENIDFPKEKIIRMKIPHHLYKKYKIICAQKDLSMPKQTAELIRKFIEILEIKY